MDDDVRGAGAFHDVARLGALLCGLVRAKNVLSVLAQCLGIAGLVTILWWAVGYSLFFRAGCPFIGGLKFAFLHGSMHDRTPTIRTGFAECLCDVPTDVRHHYASLIIGAVAERMKFAAVLVFVGLWMFLVYFPIAHMVWELTAG